MKNYFETPENLENEIFKMYNVTSKEVDEMVKMLKDWLKEQPHLPLEESDLFDFKLRRMLSANKMSMQKTKDKLDSYYSVRTYFDEIFQNCEPMKPNIQNALNIVWSAPIKKPFGHTRIGFIKFFDTDIEKFIFLDLFKILICSLEITNFYDACLDAMLIVDLEGLTLAHAMSLNIQEVIKLSKILENAYFDRIKGVHYINCPPFLVRIVNIIKMTLKEKLANRVQVHENSSALLDLIPKELVPKDYGGENKSLKEINAEWRQFLEANNDLLAKQYLHKSNEKLRPGKPLDNEYFGLEGSFRKLELD